jgi:uncharacterized protein YbaR (Trm112 family)
MLVCPDCENDDLETLKLVAELNVEHGYTTDERQPLLCVECGHQFTYEEVLAS